MPGLVPGYAAGHRSDVGTACFHISACKGTARKGVHKGSIAVSRRFRRLAGNSCDGQPPVQLAWRFQSRAAAKPTSSLSAASVSAAAFAFAFTWCRRRTSSENVRMLVDAGGQWSRCVRHSLRVQGAVLGTTTPV